MINLISFSNYFDSHEAGSVSMEGQKLIYQRVLTLYMICFPELFGKLLNTLHKCFNVYKFTA